MNSIWTNLLFLHGHVSHKRLPWKPDTQTRSPRRPVVGKTGRSILARCAVVWPRLVGLR